MRALRLSPAAEADLISVWIHSFGEWGVEQADSYLDQLESGMTYLSDHPSLGSDYGYILPGYRRLRVEHHDIIYRILATEILVVRVLHEDMDAPRRHLE